MFARVPQMEQKLRSCSWMSPKRHFLDEANVETMVEREVDQGRNSSSLTPAQDDLLSFMRWKPAALGGLDAAQDGGELADARDFVETRRRRAVEADVDALHAGFASGGAMRPSWEPLVVMHQLASPGSAAMRSTSQRMFCAPAARRR